MMGDMSAGVEEAVRLRLSGDSPCYGHSKGQSHHHTIESAGAPMACFSCDAGYVSKIIQYGKNTDTVTLKSFVSEKMKGIMEIRDEDIRVATRHPWEMGLEESSAGDIVLIEAYWTQYYRRTKSDDPARTALFRCTSCGSLFTQPLNSIHSKCGVCGKGGSAQ